MIVRVLGYDNDTAYINIYVGRVTRQVLQTVILINSNIIYDCNTKE